MNLHQGRQDMIGHDIILPKNSKILDKELIAMGASSFHRRNWHNAPTKAQSLSNRATCQRCWVITLAIGLLVGFGSSVTFSQPLVVGSADCPDLKSATKVSGERTIVIETPQQVTQDLIFPPNLHLLFRDRGRLVKSASLKKVRVTIQGSVTAPIRTIFEGFEPGEVNLGGATEQERNTRFWRRGVRTRIREVYPQWWGAKGDGKADDTDALQCAVDAASNVFLPFGSYRITRPLDITNKRDGFRLMGYSRYPEGRGSEIIADTGGVALDLTGSTLVTIEDISIRSGNTGPSTVGILMGREQVYRFCGHNSLARVRIDLRSNMKANGGRGTVGIYNSEAEECIMTDCFIYADVPLVLTTGNPYGIAWPHRRYDSMGSMSAVTLLRCSFMTFLGPAIHLVNAVSIQFIGCNLYALKRPPDSPIVRHRIEKTQWAIKVEGRFAMNISFRGHIEQWHKLLHVATRMIGCRFEGDMTGISSHSSPLIFVDGSGSNPARLEHCTFNIRGFEEFFQRGKDTSHVYLKVSGKNAQGVIGCTFHVHKGQSFEIDTGVFQGNMIYSSDPNTVIKINSKVRRASYVLCSPAGIEIVGTRSPSKHR